MCHWERGANWRRGRVSSVAAAAAVDGACEPACQWELAGAQQQVRPAVFVLVRAPNPTAAYLVTVSLLVLAGGSSSQAHTRSLAPSSFALAARSTNWPLKQCPGQRIGRREAGAQLAGGVSARLADDEFPTLVIVNCAPAQLDERRSQQ